jgi:hypothetical protein
VKLDRPVGAQGRIIGFAAINWHGLIVEQFQVVRDARGLFLEFPRRNAGGRWVAGCPVLYRS